MLTKAYKISKTINTLIFASAFLIIPIGAVIWWRRNKKRKLLSGNEYFFTTDTIDSTDEELQELNNENRMMIKHELILFYGHYFLYT